MKKGLFNAKWVLLLCSMYLFFTGCNQKSDSNESSAAEHSDEHSGQQAEAGASNEMMDLMHENMKSMQEVERKGDPDHDFALLMATHHEGAIKMAEEEVENGKDTMLVSLARMDIPKQKEERDRLKEFADNHKTESKDTSATSDLMHPMKNMMAGMNHTVSGSTDHHFASMMSMHHQSGIDMAKAYLPKAKAPAIKSMAEKIIEEQQKEKQKLDKWLAEHQM